MALPAQILCRLSSESAGYLSLERVSAVEMHMEDLAARILGVCGKNPNRVRAILAGGSLVSGEVRIRWDRFEASEADVATLLDRFPDHDPDLLFEASRCDRMLFRDAGGELEITRAVGKETRLLRRKAFWTEAVEIVAAQKPRCVRHSYSHRADVFVAEIDAAGRAGLAALAPRLRYTSLQTRLRSLQAPTVILFVARI